MASDWVIPAALPMLLLAEHQLAPLDIARRSRFDQGEQRVRQLFRSVPERANVAWLLSQAEFDVFHEFFESELLAGARRFDLQIARQGDVASRRAAPPWWWAAQFEQPYQVEMLRGRGEVLYRVTATLLLFGPPTEFRIPPGIQASGTDSDTGRASFTPFTLRASGTDADAGGWFIPAATFNASGTDSDAGGWFTGLAPAVPEDDLAQAWLFRSRLPESFADDDALTLAHLTI